MMKIEKKKTKTMKQIIIRNKIMKDGDFYIERLNISDGNIVYQLGMADIYKAIGLYDLSRDEIQQIIKSLQEILED